MKLYSKDLVLAMFACKRKAKIFFTKITSNKQKSEALIYTASQKLALINKGDCNNCLTCIKVMNAISISYAWLSALNKEGVIKYFNCIIRNTKFVQLGS